MSDFSQIGQTIGKLLAEAKARPNVISPEFVITVETKALADAISSALKQGALDNRSAVEAVGKSIAGALVEGKAEPFQIPAEILSALAMIGQALSAIEIPAVDVSPIVEAFDRNTAALADNTAALREQLAALKADKTINYDDKGRVSRIVTG